MLFKHIVYSNFKMAAMLQQQYVVQETEPRDWAACVIYFYSVHVFTCTHGYTPITPLYMIQS